MEFAKGISTLMTSGQVLTGYGSDLVHNLQLYRSVLGAL